MKKDKYRDELNFIIASQLQMIEYRLCTDEAIKLGPLNILVGKNTTDYFKGSVETVGKQEELNSFLFLL